MASRYALKGINDEATECTICGKAELKRVVWLVKLDPEGNEISQVFPVGTTCGAKMLNDKQQAAKLRKMVRSNTFEGLLYWEREVAFARHPRHDEWAALNTRA